MFIEEKIDSLMSRLEAMETQIHAMALTIGCEETKGLTAKDIARLYGVSAESIYRKNRYLLPDYGKNMKTRNTKWTFREVLAWNEHRTDHKQVYEEGMFDDSYTF